MRKLLFVISLAVIAACTEQPEVIPYDYTHVFTGDTKKAWTIRSYQVTEEGGGAQTYNLPDCYEDDLYVFYANPEKRMEVLDNSNKCSADDPDLLAEGSWGFSNTGASMTIPFPLFGEGPVPFIVRDIQDDRMTLEIFFSDNSGSYRFNFDVEDIE